MTAARKFMFDVDFNIEVPLDDESLSSVSEAAIAVDEIVEAAAPSFSEEDLALARQEGFETGRAEALRESAAAAEREILLVLDKIGAELEKIIATQTEANI
ncbi:MAG: hypothetical protein O2944_05955 [Proteobacteria bacterium]|nr:hypothetical protein [Pseudomonadota bacterium]